MKNKILIELLVPQIDQIFYLYIPVNKKIGNIIGLLNKAITDMTGGEYVGTNKTALYDRETGNICNMNYTVKNSGIKNGATLILI